MTLSDLKPRGYKLSDVEPDFRGMPLKEWLSKQIASQCGAYVETPAAIERSSKEKWRQRAIATPRNNYGWKSA